MSKINLTNYQTIAQAAKQIGCSRQRIYQIITGKNLPTMRLFGKQLVPKPFPHVIDKAYQDRARQSKNQ